MCSPHHQHRIFHDFLSCRTFARSLRVFFRLSGAFESFQFYGTEENKNEKKGIEFTGYIWTAQTISYCLNLLARRRRRMRCSTIDWHGPKDRNKKCNRCFSKMCVESSVLVFASSFVNVFPEKRKKKPQKIQSHWLRHVVHGDMTTHTQHTSASSCAPSLDDRSFLCTHLVITLLGSLLV